MTEPQVRELFNQIADGEAGSSGVDTQLALRRGRARLRWRRIGLAATPVVAAATVAIVILALAAGPVRPAGQAANHGGGPAAPRQFNPLVQSVIFGWLPAGQSLQQGGITPAEAYMAAGPNLDWSLDVYARGQCRLTGSASGLNCPGSKLQFSQRAPDVAGHRAFWTGPGLAWQYARGGWAWLSVPAASFSAVQHDKKLQREALKIAKHVRYDATTPLVFPAQLSGLPSDWRIHNTHYYADAGVLRADEYMLTTPTSRFHPHVGDLGVWTDAPYIDVHPAPSGSTCTPHDPAYRNTPLIIHGYRVVLQQRPVGGLPSQQVCGAHADGLWFNVEEFGAHLRIGTVSLVRHHMKLLGTNPADWTTEPIK